MDGGTAEYSIQLAKLQGASIVVLSKPIEVRRKIGLEVGAYFVVNPLEEDLHERFLQAVGHGATILLFSGHRWERSYLCHYLMYIKRT